MFGKANFFSRWYLILAPLFAIAYASLVPPGKVPDESVHFLRAAHLATGKLFPQSLTEWAGGEVPTDLARFMEGAVSASPKSELWNEPIRHSRTFVSFQCVAPYTFVPYIPQATAIFVARLLGLRPIIQFYLGRFIGAVLAVFLTWLALRITPVLGALFFLVSFLPVVLQSFASFSADSITLSASFLASAILLRGLFFDENLSRGLWLSLVALTGVIALSKFPYVVPVIFYLMISTEPKGRRITLLVSTLFFALLGALHAKYFLPAHTTYPGYAVDRVAQLLFVREHPIRYFGVLLLTLFAKVGNWLLSIFTLGLLDVPLNKFVSCAYLVLLFAAALNHSIKVVPRIRMTALATVLVSFILILSSQYLVWTPVGASLVEGITGRYFIPLLPWLALMMGFASELSDGAWTEYLPVAALTLSSISVVTLLRHYYGFHPLPSPDLLFGLGVLTAILFASPILSIRSRRVS